MPDTIFTFEFWFIFYMPPSIVDYRQKNIKRTLDFLTQRECNAQT